MMAIRFRIMITSLLLCCTGYFHSFGQYENVWALGIPSYNGSGLNFNTAPPTFIQTSMSGYEGTASVCDVGGQLLFYSEGMRIWDKNNNLMPNGSNLTPFPTVSSCQGTVIAPMPGSAGRYYVFSLTACENGSNMGRLYYSVVDMSLNNGSGDVIAGQKAILLDTLLTERMTAFSGEDCNVWLLAISRSPIAFKAYEITDAGISVPVQSNIGSANSLSGLVGCICVSPNRKKIAVMGYDTAYSATLCALNPATGVVAQPMVIMYGTSNSYGTAFSSDNSKLYVTSLYPNFNPIYQFDLSSGNPATIASSQTVLGSVPGVSSLKLGPDGKIYFHAPTYTAFGALGTINFPDSSGTACGFTPDALPFPNSTTHPYSGFPNAVPVIVSQDSFYNTTYFNAPCFTSGNTLQAFNDTTGWNYIWNNGTTGASLVANGGGTYWVSYLSPPNCTYHVDTIHVAETQLPLLQAIAGCKNESNAMIIAIPQDTLGYTYTWRLNNLVIRGPLQSSYGDTLSDILNGTDYSVQISAPNGCDTTVIITTLLPNYQASFSVSDSIICTDDLVAFQNSGSGGFTNYQWDFGDGSTFSGDNPQHTYPLAGRYTVQLIALTAYPCYDTTYKTILVDAVLPAKFVMAPGSICTGQAVVFIPETDSTTTSLAWQWGDGTGLNSSNGIITHAYDEDGIWPVQLTRNLRACLATTFTDTVYVYPLPFIYLGPDSGLCLKGKPVFLKNLRPAPSVVYHCLWSTGERTESIKVVQPGTYSLTIKTDPLGCSTTETIEVKKDCYIDIPNVFTPNNDGINDYFFPRQLLSEKIKAFHMKILNRWGQVIFETDRTDGRGWDGRFNGVEQPQGVYVYLIELTMGDDIEEQYQGNVTLLK